MKSTYRAWLSAIGDPVADRVNHPTRPFKTKNGDVVANDWADLLDGTIVHAIDADETGDVEAGANAVWTGTEPDGAAYAGYDCSGWTQGSMPLPYGRGGFRTSTSAYWTNQGGFNCSGDYHIYCFEQ